MVVSIDNPTANRRPAAREIDKVFFMVASGERELRDQGLGVGVGFGVDGAGLGTGTGTGAGVGV